VALASALVAACVVPARAQSPAGGRVEIGGGAAVAGGFDLDRRTAQLTSNTTTGGTYDFFDVEGRMKTSYGPLGRIGVYLTRALSVEGGVQWMRGTNAQTITNDVEDAPDITAEETVNQYLFEGSALWHLGAGSSVTPFVYGGAGYLRVLHEGDALVEEGVEIHAGIGLKWWVGRRVAIRGDGGVSIRKLGGENDDKRRTVPVAGGSVIWVF
jgi:Outer membrane protein beta-barrel domain